VIEQFLDRGLVDVPTLFGMARRLRASGRDGSVRLARVLESRPAWLRPKDSDLEVKVLRALAERDVVLETQIEFDLGGVTIHIDAGDRERRFGLEVDHVTWHGGRIDSQYDKWRDRQLSRRGWLVCRVTDDDLIERFNATIDDVAAIYHLRPAA
jgi:very-short-patch-repair endonuclease